jgi:PAS domain S-box-containing protein
VKKMSPEHTSEDFESLIAILPQAIVGLDANGRVDLWSAGAVSLFGWNEEEALGKPLPACLGVAQGAHLGSRAPVRTKDGRLLQIEFRTVKLNHDRTMLIAGETGSRSDAEIRLQELLELAPDAIVEVDRQGQIVFSNKVTQKLFGYSPEELLGSSVDMLLPEAARGRHAMQRADYASHPTTRPMGQRMQLSALRRDGSDLPVEISLSPIKSGDHLTVMAIIRDVSERRIFDRELRKANQELEARNREVENANQLKSEFLASVSHELRTPLHTILGFTELLEEERQGSLNVAQKRFVGHVHRDSVHLLELINDILDLSKIEANKMELQLERFDAREAVREALQALAPAAQSKGIVAETRLDLPVFVLADRVRFREIVTNLLSNAIKFTSKGGQVWVEMSLALAGNAAISICDSGIGIAPANQEVIFDRFRQVGSTTSGVREGTGLGLAIVQRLVEMHGGTIKVDSALGRGSVFTFTIPLDPEHLQRPFVLIIEDEPAGRELLASYLEPMGIRTEFAATADQGIAMARRLRPDAITLDLVLPGLTGWRVLEELRAAPETSHIPIFVVSVLDKDRAAVARGATEYLQKPLKKEVLLRALREHAPKRFGCLEIESSR